MPDTTELPEVVISMPRRRARRGGGHAAPRSFPRSPDDLATGQDLVPTPDEVRARVGAATAGIGSALAPAFEPVTPQAAPTHVEPDDDDRGGPPDMDADDDVSTASLRLRAPMSGRPVDAIHRPLPMRGRVLGLYTGGRTLSPDLELERPAAFRHNDSFADDETYGPYGDDADMPADPDEPIRRPRSTMRVAGPPPGPAAALSPLLRLHAEGVPMAPRDPSRTYGAEPGATPLDAPTVSRTGSDEPQRPTAEETADAEDRDRRRRIIASVAAGLGGVIGAVGAGKGMGGLYGLGAAMGAAGQAVPTDLAMSDIERRNRVRDEFEARQRAEQDRAMEQGWRERAISLSEANAESGRRNAQVRLEQEGRIQEREDAEHARRFDPQHPAAQTARQRFESLLASYGPSVGDWSDVVESLPNLGAEDIEANIDDLEHRAALGLRRTRGGGGGGSGVRLSDVGGPEAYDQLLEMRARQTGADPAMLRALYPANDRRALERLRNDAMAAGTVDVNNTQRAEAIADRDEASAAIPGLRLIGNARPSARATDNTREIWARFQSLSRAALQLQRLGSRLSAAQAAAGHGIGGVRLVGEDLQLANQLQEQVSNALRNIGGYGVPNGTELQRMEALAPRFDTLDGLINGSRAYEALRRVMYRVAVDQMRANGYEIDRGGRQ